MQIGHTYKYDYINCDFGIKEVSLDHLIFTCSLHYTTMIQEKMFMWRIRKFYLKSPVNILPLLNEMDDNDLGLIFKFIAPNNILMKMFCFFFYLFEYVWTVLWA